MTKYYVIFVLFHHCVLKNAFHFLNNSVKNELILSIFGAQFILEIWHQMVINLPTSPVYCGRKWSVKSRASVLWYSPVHQSWHVASQQS